MPTNERVRAAARLAQRAGSALTDLGFRRRGARLNRKTDSKYAEDQWAFVNVGVYSAEVASLLEWPEPSDPVHIEYCQLQDRLPRRYGSVEWPLKGSDNELTRQLETRGIEFYRAFDSPEKIVKAWTAGRLDSAIVNPTFIAVLANRLGNRTLVESIVREGWRESIGRPFQDATERVAGKLGVDLENPA